MPAAGENFFTSNAEKLKVRVFSEYFLGKGQIIRISQESLIKIRKLQASSKKSEFCRKIRVLQVVATLTELMHITHIYAQQEQSNYRIYEIIFQGILRALPRWFR